jgi:hypothetical protein
MTPDQLQAGYEKAFNEVYRLSNMMRRLWGTSSYKNFFYPMNLGFRGAVRQMARDHQRRVGTSATQTLAAQASYQAN